VQYEIIQQDFTVNDAGHDSQQLTTNSWTTVLPEKLIGAQLVKKFLAFYGSCRFITTFTTTCHL